MKILVVGITLLLLTACQSNKNYRADYQSFIKTEKLVAKSRVQQFRFQGWQPLDDRYLILASSQNKSYLVKLMSFCSELPYAINIQLKQGMASSLSAKFDSIIVPGQISQECTIDNIYEMDKDQLKSLLAFSNNDKEFR